MEASEIFKDNVFINKAYKLYVDASTGKLYTDEEEREFVYSKCIGNLYRQKIETVTSKTPIVEVYKREVKNGLAIKPLYFNNLWQFCQFIRWAEKVVFYKNDVNNTIYVDSAIDDLDCRLLVYTTKDFQIKFKLEKVANPAYIPNTLSDILSMNDKTPKYFKSMKMIVERSYGKNMKNTFTIIDDRTDFGGDLSDTLLYETIEKYLSEEIERVIKEIFDMIYEIYKVDY